MSEALKKQLDELTLPQLRKEAASIYGLRPMQEWTKENLIERILATVESTPSTFVTEGSAATRDNPRCGMSRITVSNSSGQPDTHCRVNHNGYQVFIPFEVEVEIPTITADYIKGLKQMRLVAIDPTESVLEKGLRWVPRYTVGFVWRDDGPCPCPDKYMGVRREAVLAPKRRFLKQFGFWPSDKKLREYAQNHSFNMTGPSNPA